MRRVRISISRLMALVGLVSACSASFFSEDAGFPFDAGVGGPDAGASLDAGAVDSGPAPTPCTGSTRPVVMIQIPAVGSCPTYSPCGGDPTGTWTYSAGCVDNPFSAATGLCAGLTTVATSGTVQGCLAFGGGLVQRDMSWAASTTVHIPQSCLSAIVPSCTSLQTVVAAYVAGATCGVSDGGGDDAGPGCDCTGSLNGGAHDTVPIAIHGNSFSTTPDAGAQHAFDFCVNGNALSHRETDAYPTMPGTYQLTRN